VVGGLGVTSFDELGDAGSILIRFGRSRTQHEFERHAAQWGVTGNWSKETLAEFEGAIMKHVTSGNAQVTKGTFRGTIKVTHYFDPESMMWVAVDENNEFIATWKLSRDQRDNLLRNGNVQ
jgi:hypothetical protein